MRRQPPYHGGKDTTMRRQPPYHGARGTPVGMRDMQAIHHPGYVGQAGYTPPWVCRRGTPGVYTHYTLPGTPSMLQYSLPSVHHLPLTLRCQWWISWAQL